ncbi:hypothetical protein CTEN210_09554 [Chaetoceros tenuissimus]|uniref:Uncharacterized protein n=1 Tax=Chaetoceros tenuissimus TaxID=426638 RepID=A0AAD3CVS7_9STRA|nr:hypothetical protein CTEN210_09554 [Chaetoceros tenuissimus]
MRNNRKRLPLRKRPSQANDILSHENCVLKELLESGDSFKRIQNKLGQYKAQNDSTNIHEERLETRKELQLLELNESRLIKEIESIVENQQINLVDKATDENKDYEEIIERISKSSSSNISIPLNLRVSLNRLAQDLDFLFDATNQEEIDIPNFIERICHNVLQFDHSTVEELAMCNSSALSKFSSIKTLLRKWMIKSKQLLMKDKRQRHELANIMAVDIDQLRCTIVEEKVDSVSKELHRELQDEVEFRLEMLHCLKSCQKMAAEHDDITKRMIDSVEKEIVDISRSMRNIEIKDKADLFKMMKRDKEIEQEEFNVQRSHHEEKQRIKRIMENSERVHFRSQVLLEKQKALEEKSKLELEEEAQRQKRLEMVASSVPYHSKISNMKANILKSTAARSNDYYEPLSQSGLKEFQHGKAKFFSESKVFSDPKFRLAHSLHERGVANSAVALAIVERVIVREKNQL